MRGNLPGPALLFCPADRPDRYAKALERADAVILDLEDAVLPGDRDAARTALLSTPLDPTRVIVRVNPVGSADFGADLRAVAQAGYGRVMIAKTESAADCEAVAPVARVIALCETARGIMAAEEIAAHAGVDALMWGAEDLIASLGGWSSRGPDGQYRDVARHARSRVLLAAGAYGKAAIDAVHLDIADVEGLAAECRDAAASGFQATACIHPSQAAVVRSAYRPAPELVEQARLVLAAATKNAGAFRLDGRMVDEPVIRHAREVLARAGE